MSSGGNMTSIRWAPPWIARERVAMLYADCCLGLRFGMFGVSHLVGSGFKGMPKRIRVVRVVFVVR